MRTFKNYLSFDDDLKKYNNLDKETKQKVSDGIKKADSMLKGSNINLSEKDKGDFYASFAKQSLWDGIDDFKVKEARKEGYSALNASKAKRTNIQKEYEEFLKLFEGKKTETKPTPSPKQKVTDISFEPDLSGLQKLPRALPDSGKIEKLPRHLPDSAKIVNLIGNPNETPTLTSALNTNLHNLATQMVAYRDQPIGKNEEIKPAPEKKNFGEVIEDIFKFVVSQQTKDPIKGPLGRWAQKKIWKLGADMILRKEGYDTSAWMLEHSLEKNPSDIYRGNDSRIANLINTDKNYLKGLDIAIKNSNNGKIDETISVQFDGGDLYYSIHRADIHVTGYKREDGKWIIKSTLSDKYDFTEFMTYMDDNHGWSSQASKGTLANDLGTISQLWGAITPYNVTVEFWTTR